MTSQCKFKGLEFATDPIQGELIANGVIDELGTLYIHIHRIAINAGLSGLTVKRLCAERVGALGLQMTGSRRIQTHWLTGADSILQRLGKIDIDRLVTWRVGIGDISGQQLLTMRMQIERLAHESDFFVYPAYHHHNPQ